MSELQNPLFDEEKEFLERKKLEYERALRGDVAHIKDQSTKVGKVALVGAGLAGSIWLITKVFGGKKKRNRSAREQARWKEADYAKSESDHDYEFGTGYSGNGSGKRHQSPEPYKSAADSAQAFAEHHEHTHETDDLGFGSAAISHPAALTTASADKRQVAEKYDNEEFEEDPFQDLPYDDSRLLSTSYAFEDKSTPTARTRSPRSRIVGTVLQAFLQSDTGKVLIAQVAAVVLAVVTKKVGEFFPATKISDLAASLGSAPVASGISPVASLASPVPPDALNHSQSV